MACNSQTLKGITQDCNTSMGGIKKVWLAPFQDNAFTVDNTTGGTYGMVTSISGDVVWYEYNFRKNTGSMTSTLNVDPANGVNYVSTELSLVFTKMETAKRIEMSALVLADAMAVVEDCNGERWALGIENPISATSATGETGVAKSDGNKYTLVLQDESSTWAIALKHDLELRLPEQS